MLGRVFDNPAREWEAVVDKAQKQKNAEDVCLFRVCAGGSAKHY